MENKMLVSQVTKESLSKYYTCCSSCGLPCVNSEDVCPICGSTSWGWLNHGLTYFLSLTIFGYLLGDMASKAATRFLQPNAYVWVSLIMGILTIIGPIYRFSSRKYGEELDNSVYSLLIAASFIPILILLSPLLPSPKSFHYFSYFGIVWSNLFVDNYLFSKRRSPSINRVIFAIEKKRNGYVKDVNKIEDELKRIGIGKCSEVVDKVREKLIRSRDILKNEIPILDRQRAYNKFLRMYFLWRNCLLSIYNSINKIDPNDFDTFEGIIKGLKNEILDTRASIKSVLDCGEKQVIDINEYIEASLGMHEILCDALIARRASHLLSSISTATDYDIPGCPSTKIFVEKDLTLEILEKVNETYYKLKADAEVYKILNQY